MVQKHQIVFHCEQKDVTVYTSLYLYVYQMLVYFQTCRQFLLKIASHVKHVATVCSEIIGTC